MYLMVLNNTMDWTKRQTLELIELLHVHECLWNVNNEDYKNRQRKRDSLEVISRQMGINHTDIEKKITNLKIQYNREINKIKAKSGCGADAYVSNWYAFKPLKFLKKTNWQEKSGSTDSTTEEENYDESRDSIIAELHVPSTSSIIDEEINQTAKRQKLDQQAEALSLLKETRDNIITHRDDGKDEFDIFGEYIASELRGIIGKKQILETKKQIQDLIYHKKMEQINILASTTTHNVDMESSNLPSVVPILCYKCSR